MKQLHRGAMALALYLAATAAAFGQASPGTSPLSVAKGGTGAASLTANGFVIANGTSPLTSLVCTSAQLAVGQSAAAPVCRTLTGDVTIDATGVTAIGTAKVTSAMLRNSGALSVIGRSANSSGVPADISCTAASDAVLRESGSVLGCGTVATGGIANNAITDAKFRQSGALAVVGRSANSTGNVGDIQATAATGAVLRESGSTIGWGSINLATSGTVGSSLLALANGGCNAALTASNGGILWSNASQCQILAGTANANRPLVSGSSATPAWGAYSLPTSVTSGGIPYFSSTSAESSSALLAANGVMIGGGAGVAPSTVTAGTNGQLLLGVTGAAPAMASMSQDCTITNAGVITCTKTNNVNFGTAATVNTGTSGGTIPLLNGNNAHSGTQDFQSAVSLSGDISPSLITSNQNDYAPTGFSTTAAVRLSTDASRNITGLAGGADGRIIVLHNVGSFDVVLKNQDAASTAANQFLFGGDVTLLANYSITLRYDATSSRWRAITTASAGGGGGSGTVTSVTVAAGDGAVVSGTVPVTTSGTVTVAADPGIFQKYLAGLVLSNVGTSGTIEISAGVATDSADAVFMKLTSAIQKTTSAWSVGTGNGGLDTGTIANSTWYHTFVIKRPDTGVVDGCISASVTGCAANVGNIPAAYTAKRRIGSILTNGSAQWTRFIQDGDWFAWETPPLDYNAAPGVTTAVNRTLSVPPGVNVRAQLNVVVSDGSNAAHALISDPGTTDSASNLSAAPLPTVYNITGNASNTMGNQIVRTNTSSQVRTRMSATSSTLRLATLGWYDPRGR